MRFEESLLLDFKKTIRESGERCELNFTLTLNVNKIQPDTTVCRYLFIVKSLYVFRVSQHASSGVLKTVTATSGTGGCGYSF